MSPNTNSQNSFCVFILTHGRPDKVITFNTLRKSGYDGPVFLVVDNEDASWRQYVKKFGAENVIFFDKRETAKTFDEFDNFDDRRAIVYARNECFRIARKLGYKLFLQLDDDYTDFKFRINQSGSVPGSCLNILKTLGGIIIVTFNFFSLIPARSVAFSQGGDWLGGEFSDRRRKCMNSFFCSTERGFNFIGRINEDVNTYTWYQSLGNLFLTLPHIQLDQTQTQKTKGGMSSIYLNQGTYVKSFYTIICSHSYVSISVMGRTNRRLHHSINWDTAVPMLISEKYTKQIRPRPIPPPQPKVKRMTVAEINALVKMPDVKPEKEFDSDYWKRQGFYRDPKANIQNL